EWFRTVPAEQLYLPVLVIGELRRGIELLRRKDPSTAQRLEAWIPKLLASYEGRILNITREIAERWAVISVPNPLPVIDGLLAATALVQVHTLVTRNVKDVARTGVLLVNPFSEPPSGGPQR